MYTTPAPTATTQPRPNRIAPRWFTIPVVRETPLPQATAGSAW
jgi:hypothetical protein